MTRRVWRGLRLWLWLSQRLVNGRKILYLFIEVPVYNAMRRKSLRNVKRREKDRQRKTEKKKSMEVLPPYPTEQPAPAQPDLPLGWFNQIIPQLYSCGSADTCSRRPATSSLTPEPRHEQPQARCKQPQLRHEQQEPHCVHPHPCCKQPAAFSPATSNSSLATNIPSPAAKARRKQPMPLH